MDSGLRRNDGRGCDWDFTKHSKGAVGMATNPFQPPSSFQRRPESSGLFNPCPQGGHDNPADEMRVDGNRNPSSTPASPPSAADLAEHGVNIVLAFEPHVALLS